MPEVVVKSDYDGYFEQLVKSWLERKGGNYRYERYIVTAGPYRISAVSFNETPEGACHIDFYSALRSGFGHLSDADIADIIENYL